MNIGLIDVDGHGKKKKWGATIYPNLALCKIACYHRERGDDVEWAFALKHYDKIYMAKVFNFSEQYLNKRNYDLWLFTCVVRRTGRKLSETRCG